LQKKISMVYTFINLQENKTYGLQLTLDGGEEEKIVNKSFHRMANKMGPENHTYCKGCSIKSIVNNLPEDLKNVKLGFGTLQVDHQQFLPEFLNLCNPQLHRL